LFEQRVMTASSPKVWTAARTSKSLEALLAA
jgi:hypothetical protein